MQGVAALVLLRNGTTFTKNNATKGISISKPSNAHITYFLPGPYGTYFDRSFLCEEIFCNFPPCDQICNFSRYNQQELANLSVIVNEQVPSPCSLGHWCDGEVRYPCPSGTLGNKTHLGSNRCAGPCPLGFYCEEGSTAPQPCPAGTFGAEESLAHPDECKPTTAGFYTVAGSAKPAPCGSPALYCPPKSATPQVVPAGMESFADPTINPNVSVNNQATHTSIRPCGNTTLCSGGVSFNCGSDSYLNLSVPIEARTSQRACALLWPAHRGNPRDLSLYPTAPSGCSYLKCPMNTFWWIVCITRRFHFLGRARRRHFLWS